MLIVNKHIKGIDFHQASENSNQIQINIGIYPTRLTKIDNVENTKFCPEGGATFTAKRGSKFT